MPGRVEHQAAEAHGVRLSIIDSDNLLGDLPARHGFAYRLAATGFATSFDIWLQGGPDARLAGIDVADRV